MPFQWNPDRNTYGVAHADGNSDSYSDVYANCYFHCNSYCDCHGDFHSHFHPNYDSTTNSDIYAYGYFDDYTQANAYAQAACNAEGTTHPAAAPDPAARIKFGRTRPLATAEPVHGKGGPGALSRNAAQKC